MRLTLDDLVADVTMQGSPAWAVLVPASSATGHFARFVVDEHLCDEAVYGEPCRFLLRSPADPMRVKRLLDIHNTWPWPERNPVNPGIAFLCGIANPDGLTVKQVLAMTDDELEAKHDWVQWAFPTWLPSRYNPDAPVILPSEVHGGLQVEKANLKLMTSRYYDFLTATRHWRHPNDHNHLRISRLIQSLRLFGLRTDAEEIYAFAIRATSYSDETRRHWFDALNERLPHER